MGIKEGTEAVKEFKKVIDKVKRCESCGRKITDFVISRLPPKSRKRFIELANEDFVGDYGFTLKYLLDIHDGIIPTSLEQTERAEAKADEALNQLAELKLDSASEEKKPITLVNGKKLKR